MRRGAALADAAEVELHAAGKDCGVFRKRDLVRPTAAQCLRALRRIRHAVISVIKAPRRRQRAERGVVCTVCLRRELKRAPDQLRRLGAERRLPRVAPCQLRARLTAGKERFQPVNLCLRSMNSLLRTYAAGCDLHHGVHGVKLRLGLPCRTSAKYQRQQEACRRRLSIFHSFSPALICFCTDMSYPYACLICLQNSIFFRKIKIFVCFITKRRITVLKNRYCCINIIFAILYVRNNIYSPRNRSFPARFFCAFARPSFLFLPSLDGVCRKIFARNFCMQKDGGRCFHMRPPPIANF